MTAANLRKSLQTGWLPALALTFGLAATGLSIVSYMDKKSAEADPHLHSKLYSAYYNTTCQSLMATQYRVTEGSEKDGGNEFTLKAIAREDDLQACAEKYTQLKITMIKEAPTTNALFAVAFFCLAGAELSSMKDRKSGNRQPPTPRAAP